MRVLSMRCIGMAWFLCVALCSCFAWAAEWHVAPDGKADGDGSAARPWDLASALAHPKAVQPGDTILLGEGVYRGAFVSALAGTKDKPIVLRAQPRRRATLDGAGRSDVVLTIHGRHAWYQGFEVTNSDPSARRGGGVYAGNGGEGDADGVKLINLVIHDVPGSGVGFWSGSRDSEMHGCLVYYCGAEYNLDHGLYTQNRDGVKAVVGNVIFRNMAYGIHAYGSSKAFLKGFRIERNVCFDNGALRGQAAPNILVGGGCPADDIELAGNFAWCPNDESTNVQLGYSDGLNGRLKVERNSFVGGAPALRMKNWKNCILRDNRLYGFCDYPLVEFPAAAGLDLSAHQWEENVYSLLKGGPFSFRGRRMGLAEWQKATGLDANSRVVSSAGRDGGAEVLANKYEAGRATIVAWHGPGWRTLAAKDALAAAVPAPDSIECDLAGVLGKGQRYEVRDVQDFYGKPVAEGVFDGRKVSIPKPVTLGAFLGADKGAAPAAVAQPVRKPPKPIFHTGPEFNVFIVLPVVGK